jgi:hypothetical protein
MTSPVPVSSASPDAGSVRAGARARPGAEDAAWDREYGRDVWRLRELGITDRGIAHISFCLPDGERGPAGTGRPAPARLTATAGCPW